MGNPKRQHYISQCYLKQFSDPSQSGNDPRIWIFSKDGKTKELKKVEKAFVSKHIYSLKSPKASCANNVYDYSIEISLSELEDKYALIFQDKIAKRKPLSNEEHIILCAFVAAMMLRTKGQKENIEQNLDQIIEMTERMEAAHNIPPKKSNELRSYKTDAHKLTLSNLLPDITEMLVHMNLSFLCSAKKGKAKFITSDEPCHLFNPDLQWQRFYGYGLGQKNIQLTIPLSTDIVACFCWNDLRGYIEISDKRVQEDNRMIRGSCRNYFVSSSSALKRIWFSKYPLDIKFFLKKVIPNKLRIFLLSIRYKYVRRR
ncbi:MAG: DUF4238 domain-containing protein [Patescibacteria group bacterium]